MIYKLYKHRIVGFGMVLSITACNLGEDLSKPIPIHEFAKKNVIQAAGINHETGELVAITLEGNKATECDPVKPSNVQGEKYGHAKTNGFDEPCATRFEKRGNQLVLINNKTNAVIPGAKVQTVHYAVYPGSHCSTIALGSSQYETCFSLKSTCATIKKLGIPLPVECKNL